VHLLDGTTVSTPDTLTLQAKFPQPKAQKPGLGFPMIRMVVLMSLATAMVGGMAMGPYAGKETGETALFRQRLVELDIRALKITLGMDVLRCKSPAMVTKKTAPPVDQATRSGEGRVEERRRRIRFAKSPRRKAVRKFDTVSYEQRQPYNSARVGSDWNVRAAKSRRYVAAQASPAPAPSAIVPPSFPPNFNADKRQCHSLLGLSLFCVRNNGKPFADFSHKPREKSHARGG